MALFDRVTVVSLGLLGGSVARATRERGLAKEVVGVSRREETVRRAERDGVIDRGTSDVAEGVRGADLVVLASPVDVMADVLRQAASNLEAGALVTDVGSVKAPLARSLPSLLPSGVTYLGSHPMAGSHLRGLSNARADLLQGAACVLTPEAETPESAVAVLRSYWSALGMRVEVRTPGDHDREVAWVSHAPHAVAFAYAQALGDAPATAAALRGTGFRDFMRIARSDPGLWAEILLENREATLEALAGVTDAMAGFARDLERGDREALEQRIAAGRRALEDGESHESGT